GARFPVTAYAFLFCGARCRNELVCCYSQPQKSVLMKNASEIVKLMNLDACDAKKMKLSASEKKNRDNLDANEMKYV
ncbi:MAG: hypothetical protein J6U15_07425, partial [Lachnospiraceae bacterium]|nr:hypothetical protein [Lachnospiraceae bacterium]